MCSALIRIVRILLIAEEASAKGVLLIDFMSGSKSVGQLTAERGRICWLNTPTQAPTISEIFAEEFEISRNRLEETLESARGKGIPFGEELVSGGVVETELLRRTLRRQMIVGLCALSEEWAGGKDDSWSSEETTDMSYDASFTTAPIDLLTGCIEYSATLKTTAGEIPASFSSIAPKLASAICLQETGSEDLPFAPIASSNLNRTSLSAMLTLARDAMAVVRPVGLAAASIEPYGVLVHRDGKGFLCAFDRPHLSVFEVRERSEYGEILTHLMRESHGSALDART